MSFNPGRLTLARKRRGMNKKALAELAGMSERTVTALEAGENSPGAETVAALSSALEFPSSFFYEQDQLDIELEEVSFRSLTTLKASKRDAALGAGALAFSLHAYLDSQFTLPAVSLPEHFVGETPEAAAIGLRAEWELGEGPIKNVIQLLEAKGIRVFSLVEECHDVDAFSLWRNGVPFVFLNTKKSAERSRFDAAHELGHLILHRDGHTADRKAAEAEANAFASAFLMPESSILATPILCPTLENLVIAKRIWGVSVAALAYRLRSLKLISEWHYRTLFKDLSIRGWRTAEPNPMPRESSKLLAKVFATLKEEGIGKADVARQIHVTPTELDRMVFGLVMTTMAGGVAEKPLPPRSRPDWRVIHTISDQVRDPADGHEGW